MELHTHQLDTMSPKQIEQLFDAIITLVDEQEQLLRSSDLESLEHEYSEECKTVVIEKLM